ncbi:hypothetical protein DM02DRAFT_614367 [Periconia macrospinosa]|uniref:Uncharacterized protein n=1 Tax=Periconia macrospinosa TaxID=97972 RepID=A0A2V1DRJ3_9PLEO|nr:hypothetical protein DM02DRAFT_614367 [Periconia macrospinosa]
MSRDDCPFWTITSGSLHSARIYTSLESDSLVEHEVLRQSLIDMSCPSRATLLPYAESC